MIAVYDKLIYFNEASKYTILRMRTDDPSVPEEARSQYTFRDRMLRFTAVGYGLPQTDSVKLEIEGDWKEGKYIARADTLQLVNIAQKKELCAFLQA